MIDWLQASTIGELLTAVAALTGLLTALFTGYAACVLWSDRKEKVNGEWRVEWFDGEPLIYCTAENRTKSSIFFERAQVKGPVDSVTGFDAQGHEVQKGAGWGAGAAPLRGEIESGRKGGCRVRIALDGPKLLAASRRKRHIPGRWLQFVAWKLFHWRLSSGTPVRISVIIRRRSSVVRPIRLTHTMRINAPSGQQIAETILKKAQTAKS